MCICRKFSGAIKPQVMRPTYRRHSWVTWKFLGKDERFATSTGCSGGLVVGALLGMAGTFAPSASLRGLAWGIDGIALIVAAALLTIHYFRRGNDIVAAGFLVFVVGEGLILSGAAMDLAASAPLFAAGVGLWAASLALISASNVMPLGSEASGLSQLCVHGRGPANLLGSRSDTTVPTLALLRLPILGCNTVWLGVGDLSQCCLATRSVTLGDS